MTSMIPWPLPEAAEDEPRHGSKSCVDSIPWTYDVEGQPTKQMDRPVDSQPLRTVRCRPLHPAGGRT